MSGIPIQSFKPTNAPNKIDDNKLREVSELYEKQFLREMVKAMRSTVQHGGLTEPSMAENIFSEKLDHEYVENWGKSGGIGLGDVIYNQLKDKFGSAGSGMKMLRPEGPVPLDKKNIFKVDETKPIGIPVVPTEASKTGTNMSYLIQLENAQEVKSPWAGQILQSFSNQDDAQTIKVQHDNSLVSTLHFTGRGLPFNVGDQVKPGQSLGQTFPDHKYLTWQIHEVRIGNDVG